MKRAVHAELVIGVPMSQVRERVAVAPAAVLGHHDEGPNRRRFPVGLATGDGDPSSVVLLEIGPDDDARPGRFPLRWESEVGAPGLPDVAGALDVLPHARGAVMRITGSYETPVEWLEAFGAGLAGHRRVRTAVASLLHNVTRGVEP